MMINLLIVESKMQIFLISLVREYHFGTELYFIATISQTSLNGQHFVFNFSKLKLALEIIRSIKYQNCVVIDTK
jgi:hypothetical protein